MTLGLCIYFSAPKVYTNERLNLCCPTDSINEALNYFINLFSDTFLFMLVWIWNLVHTLCYPITTQYKHHNFDFILQQTPLKTLRWNFVGICRTWTVNMFDVYKCNLYLENNNSVQKFFLFIILFYLTQVKNCSQ